VSAPKLLGPDGEPQGGGAVVAVNYGDYRTQEIWVRSGANIGNWYPLGGEFGQPRVVEDPMPSARRAMSREVWRQPPGTIPLHPHWSDVLARGPVVLLTAADGDAYLAGWKAGRRDLWQSMEEVAEGDPS
jgi:hypothetical protein